MVYVLDEEREEYILLHYGILRRSGRYPWGSGDNVPQRSKSFLDWIKVMLGKGLTESEIAQGVGLTTKELRALKSIARAEHKAAQISEAQRLKEKGLSNGAIAERMGLPNESSVRSLLKPGEAEKTMQLRNIANILKDNVDEKGMIDVGVGVERQLSVSNEKLVAALAMLSEEGYAVRKFPVTQIGTGLETQVKALVPAEVTQKQAWENRANLKTIENFSTDGGHTNFGILPPKSVDSDRIQINYGGLDKNGNPIGGAAADGVIYVRPGVEDLSLGGNQYAQVRIAVDGTHFLKGMAVYKDDLPDGVDLVFNTNKTREDAPTKLDAMKPMKIDKQTGEIDMDNPFGSAINRQIVKLDANGNEVLTSAMNLIYEETSGPEGGQSWEGWSKSISSQVLSKQDVTLAERQLSVKRERSETELEDIMAITNPAVKRNLLTKFADQADADAVTLAAAAMPRQENKVLMPVGSMKDNEVYAPTFRNGERVVLVRHPHGGTFEIPELTVNNRNREAKGLLGEAPTAIGINAKVAERLSGADFDGDTVLVIPNNRGEINTTPALKELQGFDPKVAYKGYPGMKKLEGDAKQNEMGSVSNLITDMTIMGASQTEIAAAVRHSMVVIDAEKHNLNYKQSYIDNGIANLQKKYQGRAGGGASTIISRAGGRIDVPDRQPRRASKGGPIDPVTGKKVYEYTGKTYINKDGKVVPRTKRSEKLAETDDAFTLVSSPSGTPIENTYATYSNQMKALANRARKESLGVKNIPYSPSAKKVYDSEVKRLDAALNIAELNAPRERQAQVIANATYAAKVRSNPNMTADDKKKIKGQVLTEARYRTGANKDRIYISDREWDAIQAGAVTNNKLESILKNADPDRVKELATPRTPLKMTSTKVTRARAMANQGYTQAEIADALGVSLTTLKTSLS